MKVLVTGAKGFVGKNLCAQLNNIKTGKAKCYGDLVIDEVFEYDLDSTPEQLGVRIVTSFSTLQVSIVHEIQKSLWKATSASLQSS
jgi:UDP-glucose 4-epimerase